MIELKIKKKYFDAILQLKKPFELRHQAIPQNSIVKLIEISDDIKDVRNIDTHLEIMLNICKKRKEALKHSKIAVDKYCKFIKELGYSGWEEETNILNSKEFLTGRYIVFKSGKCIPFNNTMIHFHCDWWDNFVDNYINKEQTYLIEIAEIMEVK